MDQLKQQVNDFIREAGGTWGISLIDLDHDQSWAMNGDERFTAASVIKVPIMAAVFAGAHRGDFRLTDLIELKRDDQVDGSGVLQHMTPGIKLPIYDYIYLMIIQSDNTATNILIDLVGVEAVQSAMRELGMTKSVFYNKLCIVPVKTPARNALTASDVGECLKRLAKAEYVSLYACEQMISMMKDQQYRDCLPSNLPEEDSEIVGTKADWEVANKTGWVSGIQHDAAIFYVGNRTMVVVTLSKGCQPQTARAAMGKIGRAVYEYLKNTQHEV
ncbi:serine hydrolase [Camelliibacillus cellulosilyticus]|uniref:Serine hydrolase n=1 Tax=Camelliibacillus cellulosilyticus TaxID=2174486 RepID=A0ABV9GNI4_9BACL